MTYQLTAIIEREGSGYVSLCPELDIARFTNPPVSVHVALLEDTLKGETP